MRAETSAARRRGVFGGTAPGRPAVALLGGLLLVTACATPVGVKPVGPEVVHRTLTASAISAGTPSSYSV